MNDFVCARPQRQVNNTRAATIRRARRDAGRQWGAHTHQTMWYILRSKHINKRFARCGLMIGITNIYLFLSDGGTAPARARAHVFKITPTCARSLAFRGGGGRADGSMPIVRYCLLRSVRARAAISMNAPPLCTGELAFNA